MAGAHGMAHGISVALLRPLAALLGRLDEDGAGFLAEVGVADGMAPNVYVAAEPVDRALAAIAEARRDPAFAITLARLTIERPLGMFGHLVWLSGTVRDALTRAVRFYSMLSTRTRLVLDERADGIAVVRQATAGRPAGRGRILSELPFVSLALRGRAATDGKLALRAVRFAHSGEVTPIYVETFGAPVTFDAGVNEVELDRGQLDLALASADPITAAALEDNVARMTAGSAGPPLRDRVRAAARELGGAPSLSAIAKRLSISPRTLRRRLEDERLTLRSLVDEVRRERADELLAAGTSVKEAAFALGFSEPSAFSRAYKRWTGRPPRP
jgi:AraC-like DNA-binding protein